MGKYIKVGELISRAAAPKCGNGEYPIISMTMHEGLMFQNERFKKQIASKDQSNYKVVYRHQLVQSFPIDEGVLGVQELAKAGIVSPAYKIWDVNIGIIEPKFLELALRSPRSIDYYKAKLRGTTARRRTITDAEFLNLDISCPDVVTQKKIVSEFVLVNNIIRDRKKEIELLESMTKSRFLEAFGDPIVNPMRWPVKSLKELSVLITNGNTPKGGSKNYVDGGIIFLRSQNVWRNFIDLSDVAYIDTATHECMKKSSVHKNDILITKTGRINTENSSLGRAALYKGIDNSANINGHVYLIRLSDEVVPEYIVTILIGEAYRKYIRKVCVGGIDKRQINLDQVEEFPIIMPPKERQQQFATFVKSTDKSKQAIRKSLDETQLLFDSLMQKYFG